MSRVLPVAWSQRSWSAMSVSRCVEQTAHVQLVSEVTRELQLQAARELVGDHEDASDDV